MIEVKKDQMQNISDFFQGIQDSMIPACLQGNMGKAYIKSWEHPQAALIVSGEYSFFGGNAGSEDARYLTEHLFEAVSGDASTAIFAEDRPEWEQTLMGCSANHPQSVPRYGIVQKDYCFDQDLLRSFIAAVPEGFLLKPFDRDLYDQAMGEEWSREFCETFGSAESFLKNGFGFAAVTGGKLVSGASTMTVYDGGAEVQVATHAAYRKKGLALACAAAMILESVKRGIRPCWDAANQISLKMALALGYEYKGEYTTVYMQR